MYMKLVLYQRYFQKAAPDCLNTRNRCPKSNEHDGIDTIFEIDETSEVAGNISNDSSDGANDQDGNNKSRIASPKAWNQ